MLVRAIGTLTLIAAILLVVLVQSTTPSTTSPVSILAIFGLIYTLAFGVLTFFIYWASFGVAKIGKALSLRRLEALSIRRASMYALVVAFAPVILLAMQSVGAMSFTDVLLVVLFEAVALFYMWRRG